MKNRLINTSAKWQASHEKHALSMKKVLGSIINKLPFSESILTRIRYKKMLLTNNTAEIPVNSKALILV